MTQVFTYGGRCPVCDADCKTDNIGDSDDFNAQSMCEVASMLCMAAGRHIYVAMTVDKLQMEIQSDGMYKSLRQTNACKFTTICMGELATFNYHKDNLSVNVSGLIMYKGTRFLVPKSERTGLLISLHMSHPGLLSMVLRAKESF